MTIAQEIITQIGGNRFIAMTGATEFYAYPDGVSFRIPPRSAKNGINYVHITLTPDALYSIEFWAMNKRAMKYKVKATHLGVSSDQLEAVFTTETGLRTQL